MNMVHSRKVKDVKSTYKENIISVITPYQLVGEIQQIEKTLWERKKKRKKYSPDGTCDRMCLSMTKLGIICGKSLFWCELSDFWGFMKTYEDTHPLHCVVMKILQGKMNHNRTL